VPQKLGICLKCAASAGRFRTAALLIHYIKSFCRIVTVVVVVFVVVVVEGGEVLIALVSLLASWQNMTCGTVVFVLLSGIYFVNALHKAKLCIVRQFLP
jgi:hypothetical protein